MRQRTVLYALTAGLALVLTACTQPPPPQLGDLLVDILGLPAGVDAAVTVSGSDSFSQDVVGTEDLSDLAPGNYNVAVGSIATSAVTEYIPTTDSIDVAVVANQTAVASITYSTTLGALEVVVAGLAADADAEVTVTGPDGFSATSRRWPRGPVSQLALSPLPCFPWSRHFCPPVLSRCLPANSPATRSSPSPRSCSSTTR